MRHAIIALGLLTALFFGSSAQAQVWVQIEAQPTLFEGEERARAYAAAFPDVAGFQMSSGWYAITLGPYAPDSAALRLNELRAERLIPSDSYINDGSNYRQAFWPVGTLGAPPPPLVEVEPLPDLLPEAVTPDLVAEPLSEPVTEILPEPAPAPEETASEARRSEQTLSRDDRMALQTALKWFGFYTSAIDGAFGPGTRNSMAAWQEANADDPTGILTTRQRTTLRAGYAEAQAELGLQTVTEAEAGIAITLPMALVRFDHYEPPFVHFASKGGSGVSVILLSQPGDQGTLYGLYDMLQTLEVVPLDGTRERREQSFTIEGRSADLASYTYAELSRGLVKGYMLVWNPQDDDRMARVLTAMQTSFEPVGNRALDPGLVPMPDEARQGLLAGLEVRRPKLSRSGFFVDAAGAVLTTTEAVNNCSRVTIDRDLDADVVFADAALGIALVKPRAALSPRAFAAFKSAGLRPGSEIAVAGYSYEDALPAPTLTFGALEDTQGLDGDPGLHRLSLMALPGDAGGPVFNGAGAVLGMLLPKARDGARQLPAEVSFAVTADAITSRLAQDGTAPRGATPQGALAPEDLTQLAESMTVLVSCWN